MQTSDNEPKSGWELPRENTTKRLHYKEYYSQQEVIDKVAETNKKSIELMGYKF